MGNTMSWPCSPSAAAEAPLELFFHLHLFSSLLSSATSPCFLSFSIWQPHQSQLSEASGDYFSQNEDGPRLLPWKSSWP